MVGVPTCVSAGMFSGFNDSLTCCNFDADAVALIGSLDVLRDK